VCKGSLRLYAFVQINSNGLSLKLSNDYWELAISVNFIQYHGICTTLILAVGNAVYAKLNKAHD
jgi:hypothetical protein